MKRHLRIVLKVSAVLSLLSAVSWVSTNVQATRRLEGAIARARAAGLPLAFAEIEVADVPDEENAALLYLDLAEQFRRVEGYGEVCDSLMEYDGTVPVPEELKQALPAFEETFRELRRAAKLPHCAFPARSGRPHGSRTRIRFTGVFRLTNALAASAVTRAQSGDLDGAVQDLRATLAMSEAIASLPSVANQMIRIVGLRRAADAARVLMTESASATEALDDIGFPSLHGSISYGIVGEMAFLGLLFGEDGTAPVSAGFLRLGSPDSTATLWLENLAIFVTRPYWRNALVGVIDYNRECVLASQLPYPEGLERMNELVSELEDGWNPLMQLLCGRYTRFLEGEAQAAARLELLRLGALVLDHRRSTGSYPAALTDLDGPLPLDPRTGSPFLLERDAGDVLLRSGDDDELSWRLPS